MSFMTRKKRFKFEIVFEAEDLSSVTFKSGLYFYKLRLVEGGSFVSYSTREEVKDTIVRWPSQFHFVCKMVASASTGILDPCYCRVSVRQDVKGGRSYKKLGFVDINLAEFAGSGKASHRYLLEGYDSKARQTNCMLKVNINTLLLCGDPLFKAPHRPKDMDEITTRLPENRGAEYVVDYNSDSVKSGSLSSGFDSLDKSYKRSMKNTSHTDNVDAEHGHVRNSSDQSKHSRVSGYCSYNAVTHSRQSSLGTADTQALHVTQLNSMEARSISTSSLKSSDKLSSTWPKSSVLDEMVDSTRIDNDNLVEQLLEEVDLNATREESAHGLQLFVGKDGTTAFTTQQIRSKTSGKFEEVVFSAPR